MEFAKTAISERAAVPKHIEIMPELPKTAVGKVFKPDLRRMATIRIYDAELAGAGIAARVAEVVEDKIGWVRPRRPRPGTLLLRRRDRPHGRRDPRGPMTVARTPRSEARLTCTPACCPSVRPSRPIAMTRERSPTPSPASSARVVP